MGDLEPQPGMAVSNGTSKDIESLAQHVLTNTTITSNQVSDQQLFTAMWFNAMLGFICFVAFCFLQRSKRLQRHYRYRMCERSSVSVKPRSLPTEGWSSLWQWLINAIVTPEKEILTGAGLDALVMTWTLKIGISLFLPMAFIGCVLLIPLHYAAFKGNTSLREDDNVNRSQLMQLTIAALPDRSPVFWLHFVLVVAYNVYAMCILFWQFRRYVIIRHSYLTRGDDPNYWVCLTHQAESNSISKKVKKMLLDLNLSSEAGARPAGRAAAPSGRRGDLPSTYSRDGPSSRPASVMSSLSQAASRLGAKLLAGASIMGSRAASITPPPSEAAVGGATPQPVPLLPLSGPAARAASGGLGALPSPRASVLGVSPAALSSRMRLTTSPAQSPRLAAQGPATAPPPSQEMSVDGPQEPGAAAQPPPLPQPPSAPDGGTGALTSAAPAAAAAASGAVAAAAATAAAAAAQAGGHHYRVAHMRTITEENLDVLLRLGGSSEGLSDLLSMPPPPTESVQEAAAAAGAAAVARAPRAAPAAAGGAERLLTEPGGAAAHAEGGPFALVFGEGSSDGSLESGEVERASPRVASSPFEVSAALADAIAGDGVAAAGAAGGAGAAAAAAQAAAAAAFAASEARGPAAGARASAADSASAALRVSGATPEDISLAVGSPLGSGALSSSGSGDGGGGGHQLLDMPSLESRRVAYHWWQALPRESLQKVDSLVASDLDGYEWNNQPLLAKPSVRFRKTINAYNPLYKPYGPSRSSKERPKVAVNAQHYAVLVTDVAQWPYPEMQREYEARRRPTTAERIARWLIGAPRAAALPDVPCFGGAGSGASAGGDGSSFGSGGGPLLPPAARRSIELTQGPGLVMGGAGAGSGMGSRLGFSDGGDGAARGSQGGWTPQEAPPGGDDLASAAETIEIAKAKLELQLLALSAASVESGAPDRAGQLERARKCVAKAERQVSRLIEQRDRAAALSREHSQLQLAMSRAALACAGAPSGGGAAGGGAAGGGAAGGAGGGGSGSAGGAQGSGGGAGDGGGGGSGPGSSAGRSGAGGAPGRTGSVRSLRLTEAQIARAESAVACAAVGAGTAGPPPCGSPEFSWGGAPPPPACGGSATHAPRGRPATASLSLRAASEPRSQPPGRPRWGSSDLSSLAALRPSSSDFARQFGQWDRAGAVAAWRAASALESASSVGSDPGRLLPRLSGPLQRAPSGAGAGAPASPRGASPATVAAAAAGALEPAASGARAQSPLKSRAAVGPGGTDRYRGGAELDAYTANVPGGGGGAGGGAGARGTSFSAVQALHLHTAAAVPLFRAPAAEGGASAASEESPFAVVAASRQGAGAGPTRVGTLEGPGQQAAAAPAAPGDRSAPPAQQQQQQQQPAAFRSSISISSVMGAPLATAGGPRSLLGSGGPLPFFEGGAAAGEGAASRDTSFDSVTAALVPPRSARSDEAGAAGAGAIVTTPPTRFAGTGAGAGGAAGPPPGSHGSLPPIEPATSPVVGGARAGRRSGALAARLRGILSSSGGGAAAGSDDRGNGGGGGSGGGGEPVGGGFGRRQYALEDRVPALSLGPARERLRWALYQRDPLREQQQQQQLGWEKQQAASKVAVTAVARAPPAGAQSAGDGGSSGGAGGRAARRWGVVRKALESGRLLRLPYDAHNYSIVTSTFKRLFPRDYDTAIPVINHKEVDQLLMQWEATVARLERAELTEARTGRPATKQASCCSCEVVEIIPLLRDEIWELEGRIEEARRRAWHTSFTPSWFVFFRSQQAAAMAASTQIYGEDTAKFQVHPAPGPEEVNWQHLWLTWRQRDLRSVLTWPLTVAVVIFPITLVTSAVARLQYVLCHPQAAPVGGSGRADRIADAMVWPWYCNGGDMLANFFRSLVTGWLPALLLNLWLVLVLPRVVYLLVQSEGSSFSLSALERRIGVVFFYWDVFNVFLQGVIGSTFFQQVQMIIMHPEKLPNILGAALPDSSNFFIQFISMRALFLVWLRMCVPHGGVWQNWCHFMWCHPCCCSFCNTERDQSLTYGPRTPRYGFEMGHVLLIYLLSLTFSVVAPLLLPFSVVWFVCAWVQWRHNLCYVYQRKYESGGLMWTYMFSRICICLVTMQLFTFCVLAVKGAYVQAFLIVAFMPALTMKFHRSCQRRFGRGVENVPLELASRAPRGRVPPLVYVPPPLQEKSWGWYPEWNKIWDGWGMPTGYQIPLHNHAAAKPDTKRAA